MLFSKKWETEIKKCRHPDQLTKEGDKNSEFGPVRERQETIDYINQSWKVTLCGNELQNTSKISTSESVINRDGFLVTNSSVSYYWKGKEM